MSKDTLICAIAAMSRNRVIGENGKLPWHLPEDLKRFSELTRGHAVLMGRKTYQSLPPKFRPLPERENIVASRGNFIADSGVKIIKDTKGFIKKLLSGEEKIKSDKLWIIGGGQIYFDTLPYWREVYLTIVDKEVKGDTLMPEFEEDFILKKEDHFLGYSFLQYIRR